MELQVMDELNWRTCTMPLHEDPDYINDLLLHLKNLSLDKTVDISIQIICLEARSAISSLYTKAARLENYVREMG